MTIDDILNSSWLNEIQNEGQEFENKVKIIDIDQFWDNLTNEDQRKILEI